METLRFNEFHTADAADVRARSQYTLGVERRRSAGLIKMAPLSNSPCLTRPYLIPLCVVSSHTLVGPSKVRLRGAQTGDVKRDNLTLDI